MALLPLWDQLMPGSAAAERKSTASLLSWTEFLKHVPISVRI